MTKVFALVALIVCAGVFSRASCALERANLANDFTISISNSSTVPFNGHLYTVSKNQTHIHVNSTDVNYKPCDIAIDPVNDVFLSNLEVTPMEDELFIVGIRSKNSKDIDKHTIKTVYEYTLLKVDPKACSYRSIPIPEVNDDNSGDYYFPRIVSHRTGSDVFFHNLKKCAPCRLDSAGTRSSQSTPQIPRENPSPRSSLSEQNYIQYVDPIKAYFYVYDAYDYSDNVQTTKFKLLDEDFKTIKERNVDFRIHAISKQKKSNGHLGVCTKVLDERLADAIAYTEVRCRSLNSDLATTNTFVWTPTEGRSKPISSISYEFDEEGNSYISFAEDTQLRLYIHDKNGKLVKAIDMGGIDGGFEKYPKYNPMEFDEYDYWNVNGFLVGDEYCIVVGQSPHHYSTPLQQVKCIVKT